MAQGRKTTPAEPTGWDLWRAEQRADSGSQSMSLTARTRSWDVERSTGGNMIVADKLEEMARASCGLEDFGSESYREGLEVLVSSLNQEAGLSMAGHDLVTGQLVSFLAGRLQIEDAYLQHPEIDEQQITAPLFVLGLPRTGSTALGALLGQDPDVRTLRVWEASSPCPPPEEATQRSDPRISEAQARLDRMDEYIPALKTMVPVSATGPTECLQLLGFAFRSGSFEAIARVPSYTEWLLQCDMVPAYRYHQRVLKLLQWHCPPRKWRLRTPAHMYAIDALDAVYPDSRFVMTHRDVASVIPSVASLMSTLCSMAMEAPDPNYFGANCMKVWSTALHRTMDFRAEGRTSRFHDISFQDMQSATNESIRGVYEWLGEGLSPEAASQMDRWRTANARGKHGEHRYTPEEFGLTKEEIRSHFSFYTDRFSVPFDA